MNAPFLVLLAAVAGVGAVVFAIAQVVALRGRPRAAGWTLLAAGFVFFVGGVLLFAPQPLWVGAVLIGPGIARLVKAPRNEHRRSA